MRSESGEAAVPPGGALREGIGAGRFPPGFQDAADILRIPDLRGGRVGGQAAIEAGIAGAVIGNAAGSVELDRLEGPEEGPAQTEAGSGVSACAVVRPAEFEMSPFSIAILAFSMSADACAASSSPAWAVLRK